MIHNDYDISVDDDDAFGPGSDLILSLLALSLLLLGIVGTGNAAIIPEKETVCNAPDCDIQPVEDPLSLEPPSHSADPPIDDKVQIARTDLDKLRQERDKYQEERNDFEELSNKLIEFIEDRLPTSSERIANPPENIPDPINIGPYNIPLADFSEFVEQGMPISLAAIIQRNFLHDFQAQIKDLDYPILISIESETPAELITLLPTDTSGDDLISRIYTTSAVLAAAFQNILLENHIPLNCIKLEPYGHSRSLELTRAITNKDNNLIKIKQLQTLYKTRPIDENLQSSATVMIKIRQSDQPDCSPK